METTAIRIALEGKRGYLRMLLDGTDTEVGHIQFELSPEGYMAETLLVTHTYIAPEYRGQSYARELAQTIDTYAGTQGYKLDATCSYIKHYMARKAQQ